MSGGPQWGGVFAAFAITAGLTAWLLASGTPEQAETETGLEDYAQSYASFAEQLRLIATCQETPSPDCAALAPPISENEGDTP